MVGGLLLLLSWLVWEFTDQRLLGWILLTLAVPLIVEGEAWREAAYSTRYFYEIESEVVHREAYNLKAALPRYLLLYAYLFVILIGREARALPDNSWIVVIIVVPILAYAGLAVRSFVRDIRRLMKEKGVRSKWSKRHSSR